VLTQHIIPVESNAQSILECDFSPYILHSPSALNQVVDFELDSSLSPWRTDFNHNGRM
jgi:hypothetical protein